MDDSARRATREPAILLVSVFIVASCALTYELLIGTVSSYYLGSSVLHFSLTIGLFMFFLGVGAFLSKFISQNELAAFITTESLLGVCGGVSVGLLQASFSYTEHYYLVAFLLTGSIATLCGLEIPLLTRLLYRHHGLKSTIAHALSFDYVGGLVASILFPLVLLPNFGTLKTACLVGLVNLCVAGLMIWEFRAKLAHPLRMAIVPFLGALATIVILVRAERVMSVLEQALYDDEVVYASQSPYQRIVLTQFRDDVRLYLNGDLQFSSQDEYRYHEPLVHLPMQLARNPRRVLVLGGGDGLVTRELLRYPDIAEITLVDLDKEITDLARTHAMLRLINGDSLSDERVRIVNQDAWNFVRDSSAVYDVIIADLPDANDYSLGKLYSLEFYRSLKKLLVPEGVIITQAASPYFTREAFWCIHDTLRAVFPHVQALNNYVPSFGSWGYVLASKDRELDVAAVRAPPTARYLTDDIIRSLVVFDRDLQPTKSGTNRLDNQLLVQLYAKGWSKFQ